jgi:predicted lipoprotein
MTTMTTAAKESRSCWLKWTAGAALLAAFFAVAPPFRIVKTGAVRAAGFDAETAAREFWDAGLFTARPVEAAVLLTALAEDAEAAAAAHGKTAGMATAPAFLFEGSGTVVQNDADGALLRLTAGGTGQVLLTTGPVNGNAVRDCTGLLNGSSHANSQDFNALAAALNGIVENRVQPAVRALTPGARVAFTACAAPQRHQVKARPLKAIPLKVEIRE